MRAGPPHGSPIFTPPLNFETPMKVEDKPMTMPSAEKTEEVWQPENEFRREFAVFQPPRPDERGRHETARFRALSAPRRPATPSVSRILRRNRSISRPSHRSCAQSQTACVEVTLQSQLICTGNRP